MNKSELSSSDLLPTTLGIVYACFVLSGFAALLYQATWIREFAIVFGTSHLAVAIVLSAYMAGLAAGAILIEKKANRVRSPLLLYAILEGCIAVYALAFPALSTIAGKLLTTFSGVAAEMPVDIGTGQQLYFVAASLLILGPPTVAMGMTLPILARFAVRADEQIGSRIANLYASNTFGAVLGTLAAGFVLLPALGLTRTMFVGAAVNVIVALVAWKLHTLSRPLDHEKKSENQSAIVQRGSLVLFVMLISGGISFYYEILWTRLLTHLLGGSTYAYSTMLAAFLTGIALGGALSGRLAQRRSQAMHSLIAAQLGIGLASLLTYTWIQYHEFSVSGLAANATLAFAIILPGTILIGATYPLAVRCVATSARTITQTSARVYAWNTVGAIIGAVAAGFVIIPSLGFATSLKFVVFASFCLAALLSIQSVHRKRLTPVLLLTAVASILFINPQRPASLTESAAIVDDRPGEEKYYGVGKAATVFVKQIDGYFYIRSDGRPEATVAPLGAPPFRFNQFWLTALPAAARPDADSALVIGLGGGVALLGLPDSIKHVDVVEIEAEVVEANKTLSELRRIDPLADPRIRLVINDARSAMNLTSRQYDIIVSQPSHPWTAGASHLYTTEFVDIAKRRLSPGGVFLQWVNAQFVDDTLLRSAVATLSSQFEFVRIYEVEPMVLMMLASDLPIEPERSLSRLLAKSDGAASQFSQIGMGSAEDILATWVLHDKDVKDFVAGSSPVTDDQNAMAFKSSSDGNGLTPADLDQLLKPFDPLVKMIRQSNEGNWSLPHVAKLLMSQANDSRVAHLISSSSDPHLKHTLRGIALHARGGQPEEAFAKALAYDSNDQQASFGLLRAYLPELAAREAVPKLIDDARANLTGSAAAVVKASIFSLTGSSSSIAALEDSLKDAMRTDLWFQDSIRLRCDWRFGQYQATGEAGLLREIVTLTDEVLATSASLEIRNRRAAALFLLNDMRGYVETVSSIIDAVAIDPNNAGHDRLLENALRRLPIDEPGVTGERARQVSERGTLVVSRSR